MTDKKIYECVAVDEFNDCTDWQVIEHSLPLSRADANLLTVEIIGFMIFVFILKQIKRSIL